jgi:hypothetical protein
MKKESTTRLQQMTAFQYFTRSRGYSSLLLTLKQSVAVFIGLIYPRIIGEVFSSRIVFMLD